MPTRRLIAAELLKVRKRWLPYILLAVMFVGVTFQIWMVGYLAWRTSDEEFRLEALRGFALPWSFVALLDIGQFWGSFFVAILTSSVVATEHNWGTVRQALIRGQPRANYLTVKLVGIAVLSAAGLLLTLLFGVWQSIIATIVAEAPVTLDVPDGPSIPELFLMVLRAGYAIVPYGLLAFALTVVSRSTTLGVVGTLIYLIMESILVAILGELGGAAPTINAFLLGHNVAGLLAANTIGTGDFSTISFRANPFAADTPDPAAATVVIAAYCLAFLGVAYHVFRRRDLGA